MHKEEEKMIAQEFLLNVKKYFNNDDNFYTNQ